MHLANVPGHIGRRKGDFQASGDAVLVDRVHVVDPDRHPDAFVALFVSLPLKCGGVGAAAAASLRALTKKDADFLTRANCAKGRRRAPVPQFLPSPLLKPCDRAWDIGWLARHSENPLISATTAHSEFNAVLPCTTLVFSELQDAALTHEAFWLASRPTSPHSRAIAQRLESG
jgi:hypothetical protein